MIGLDIITPVYNGGTYIAETACSIAAQLKTEDRYLVVDDGSTDDTISRLAAACPRAFILQQPNGGEVAAVNAGIAHLLAAGPGNRAGRITGIVNADDPILPGLLDATRAAFAADPALDAVYPDWVKIDSAGREIVTVRTREYDYNVMLGQHYCIPGPGAFFRLGPAFNEPVRDAKAALISDYDFWLRFGLNGARIRRLPQVLASWRLHPGGLTRRSQGPTLARQKIETIERLLARPDVPTGVRALSAQARSAAYYHAALVGLRAPDVPAFRYALRSYAIKWRWKGSIDHSQRRALRHLIYAAAQPASGSLHALVSPVLPRAYRWQSVVDQTFGANRPQP
ncbi:MAG: glycosyltransferase [Bosea sp.]|nr:glycosyltransferase [Bosea sp. (in: a-proteobacteria)]